LISLGLAAIFAQNQPTIMESNEEQPVLRCDHIQISAQGMAEVHGRKVVIFVPAADIERVTLKFGRPEHNPFISITIGIVMVLVGIFGLVDFFAAKKTNRYVLGLVAFGIIGGSLIFDAFKQRYFLEIGTKKGARRLVFSKETARSDIEDLCNQARTVYQYQINEAVQHGT
jgi:hypothetical protein